MKTKVCVIAAIAICSLFAVSCNNQPKEVPAEEVVVEEVVISEEESEEDAQ